MAKIYLRVDYWFNKSIDMRTIWKVLAVLFFLVGMGLLVAALFEKLELHVVFGFYGFIVMMVILFSLMAMDRRENNKNISCFDERIYNKVDKRSGHQ